jgi:CheY-like chemotaxis protein
MAIASTLAHRRVLLVEDEYFIAVELHSALESRGAEVVGPAATVKDALALVAGAGPLDGAVLDINLRGEMAYPVADALLTRGIPFVFTTGYDEAVIPSRFTGIVRCEKPANPVKVAEVLFAGSAGREGP